MNMTKLKKKIWKILLIIPVMLLFSCPVLAYAAPASGTTTEETSAEASPSTEAVTNVKATPGDAWYSSVPGIKDNKPKTLDDIYLVLFWILVILAVYVIAKAFIWIFNSLS